jgi:hypothetical protein
VTMVEVDGRSICHLNGKEYPGMLARARAEHGLIYINKFVLIV